MEDALAKEGYKPAPDAVELIEGITGAEEAIFKFAGAGQFNRACELMAYIAHRRAGVWWGYRAAVSLAEELKIKPPDPIDLSAPPPEPELPDFAKVEIPKPDPALLASVDARSAEIAAETEKLNAAVDPAMRRYVEEGVKGAFKAFEEANGVHPMKLLETLGERMRQNPYLLDPNAPLFKAADDLKARLAAQRAQTVAQIMAAHPGGIPGFIKGHPKVAEHQKKRQDAALDAVYCWVAAPNVENSQACLDIGNDSAIAGTPEGLLALCAFWAFGNLAPQLDQVIPTPPGLASNGLDKVFLICAVQKGGTRKMEERYELYFNLGVDVLSGKDNWEDSLATAVPPHREAPGQAPEKRGAAAPPAAEKPANPPDTGYKRWKPGV
jgi:hypothetical protein